MVFGRQTFLVCPGPKTGITAVAMLLQQKENLNT